MPDPGGDELDDAIIQYIKKEYSLALGERTAEEVKIALGSAWRLQEELHAEIRGRDLVTGLPKTIVTTTEEIREAIEEPVASICDAVKVTLDKTPPELAADIMEQGIVLAGGGALAAPYAFATVDPNVGVAKVLDSRLDALAEMSKSKNVIPTAVQFVDIAGLVKGASQGEGLGNRFLAHIREVDATVFVLRAFEDTDVPGSSDPSGPRLHLNFSPKL